MFNEKQSPTASDATYVSFRCLWQQIYETVVNRHYVLSPFVPRSKRSFSVNLLSLSLLA